MSLRAAANLIEQVAEMGSDEFLLSGGEPLVRRDLPEIIRILHANRVRWSLNTAIMPNTAARQAIEQWPPYFAAVSLDGPARVHDAFRGRSGSFGEALQSIDYFANLSECGVAAGTTVTTRNFPYLDETFSIVLASSATSWGLHLLLPEGRARQRRDLFLRRAQLRRLLRFAAAKRSHFPVSMADEIGYCGLWEPMVRDTPFFCGAGRTHCVVLPDGEVVPCTTLDASASAGNVHRRPLREIWETGFAEQRGWSPLGKCVRCRYAIACRGGCWLQRRRGTECFKAVWDAPKPMKAACFALCVGLSAGAIAGVRTTLADNTTTTAEKENATGMAPGQGRRPAPRHPGARLAWNYRGNTKSERLEQFIVRWYASGMSGSRAPNAKEVIAGTKSDLPDDPAAEYFVAYAENRLPAAFSERAELMKAALKTEQRSLTLIALMCRDLMEWCLDGHGTTERSAGERQLFKELLTEIHASADAWRQAEFEEAVIPFLKRGGTFGRALRSKAGPFATALVTAQIDGNRWPHVKEGQDATKELLEGRPFGEVMILTCEVAPDTRVQCFRSGKRIPLDGTLQILDLLVTPESKADEPFVLTVSDPENRFEVELPAQAELTYGDILGLILAQHREFITAQASSRLEDHKKRVRLPPTSPPIRLLILREACRVAETQAKTEENLSALTSCERELRSLYLF